MSGAWVYYSRPLPGPYRPAWLSSILRAEAGWFIITYGGGLFGYRWCWLVMLVSQVLIELLQLRRLADAGMSV